MSLYKFFHSKKIIYTKKWQPGVFMYGCKQNGKRYLRICYPNRIQYQGMLPTLWVPFEEVTQIRKLPSPFKKWLYRQVGKKAKATMFVINRKK